MVKIGYFLPFKPLVFFLTKLSFYCKNNNNQKKKTIRGIFTNCRLMSRLIME